MREQARGERGSDGSCEIDVNQVVQRLRAIDSSAGWERTLAIGELIVSSFFEGRVRELQHARKAHQSLRRLAAHELCPLRKSALAEAMRVYAFVCENPEVRSLENVAPGHVATVLKCSTEQRLDLLRRVQLEKPTVRAFGRQVSSLRRPRSAARAAADAMVAIRKVEERLREVGALVAETSEWSTDEATKAADLLASLEHLVLTATNAVGQLRLEPAP